VNGRLGLRTPVQRYLVIGISVYAFELLVIVAAQALGASSVLAVGVAFWLGLIVSFGLQKIVTFGDKRLHHRILVPQLIAFSLLVLFNFGFTLLFTKLLEDTLPAVWCRTLALAVTTIWNFYLYKTRIFAWQAPAKGSKRKKSAFAKVRERKRKQVLSHYRLWRRRPGVKRLRKYASQPQTARWYMALSLLVLLGTTLLWSLLGVHLQQTNADQLVNARLFDNRAAFEQAVFPEQHSFLIKWPLFYVIKLFNYTPAIYTWVTALTVIATVTIFAYVLWRIERRPLVFGTLCLMLASVLLLVPAQPYAGALLPVNMAMLATRNLEYMLYIAGLVCLVRAPRPASKQFAGGAVALGLLIASDRLFLSVSIAGALLAMCVYILYRRWEFATLVARWLVAAVAAGLAAAVVVGAVNHTHITQITGSQAGPYGLAQDTKSITLGLIFAITGLATNFGANPAYDAVTLAQIPRSSADHLFSPAGPAYIINFLILVLCVCFAIRFLLATVRRPKLPALEIPVAQKLAVLLLWSAIAVTGLFIITRHYYQVDARYLALGLFALFAVLAAWLRPRRVDAELVAVCLPVLLLGIILGSVGSIQTYGVQKQALDNVNYRNEVVAQTLASHHATVLIGDYWRVLPVQSLSADGKQRVMPLENCTQARQMLASKAWQPNLRQTSFAYLLSLDKSLTDYPQCAPADVLKAYGIPNSTALIDGSLAHPKELLLFYDRGTHFPQALSTSTKAARSSLLPVELNDLTHTSCEGPVLMNIVAHEDDDLLFMNPDLQHAINAHHCVRTVYLTAGDAGGARPYWLSRELGSQAAYSQMTGTSAAWVQRTVHLPGGQYITVANIRGNDKYSLIFMHLPDGNLDGKGFGASNHESLAELEEGRISTLQSVDNQSGYTVEALTTAIAELMRIYQPTKIHTQSDYSGGQYKDHSDHRATGRIAARAYRQYENNQFNDTVTIPLAFYKGYPIHQLPANVDGLDLLAKQTAFSAYATYDTGVCRSCSQNPVYAVYLERQYRNPY
jgi:LmbE family N-acetylglucosaminyl deacetylase/putative flippase GtrA